MMKKILLAVVVLAVFGVAGHAFAEGFVPISRIPGLTDVQPTPGGLASFFNNLYKYMIGLAAILAVIMIIWGGLEISTQDSISKQKDGKERIREALFGLLLVLSPVIVFSIINPSILNLSINLQKLDTTSGPSQNNSPTTNTTLSDTQIQDRQSSGGTVLYAFELTPAQRNATPVQVRNILNAKQPECTAASGGPGIILPERGSDAGGGQYKYVCQTCPSNTTLTLLSSCSLEQRICGSCVAQ